MVLRLLLALSCAASLASPQPMRLRVVSSRPDLVTGGSALVEVEGAPARGLRVRLNGKDITGAFRPVKEGGRPAANVENLKPGKNVIEARAGGARARLTLVNHPSSGPAFSGPHQSPFVCQTVAAGLGEPLDSDCTAKTQVAWFYRSTAPASPPPPGISVKFSDTPPGFKPYDPAAPRPADMARTTTTEGETVDFIVRREAGAINRAIYQIAFLHDPRAPLPDPWTRAAGWNGRLVYSFGGGCSAGYRQGLISAALDAGTLGKGFATAASSLNVFGNNCDDVISAETMMMVKAHFVKSFGPPAYTIGSGGSGGSMQQHLIAQNYPGLLDGIIPAASYPDTVTTGPPVVDCSLLARAIDASTEAWTDAQKTAVSGYATWGTCQSWMKSFSPSWLRPGACNAVVPKTAVYDASTNPKGVRCSIYDNQVNVYGRDPRTGFARRAYDNTGVQYGLAAFQAGTINAEQFVQLNERAGGYDPDGNFVAVRSVADPLALRTAYRTGRVNQAGGSLPDIPILDVRQYLDPKGDIHDRVRSFAMGARLSRAAGSSANRVMLVNPRNVQPVLVMDQWLAAIRKDSAPGTAREKTIRNKPPDLADACWTDSGEKIAGTCNDLYPVHADPRIAAGAPLAGDVLKCALKPLDPGDYKQPLSADQVSRLRAAFPQGVCDYTRPGVGQDNKPEPWSRY